MTENQDQARIAEAQAAQARMLAALPDFPQFGFYVHTGLAGYGPDLEDGDYPARSWEDVASQVAWELRSAADFSHEGARVLADQAKEAYEAAQRGEDGVVAAADLYHEAWTALRLSWELDNRPRTSRTWLTRKAPRRCTRAGPSYGTHASGTCSPASSR